MKPICTVNYSRIILYYSLEFLAQNKQKISQVQAQSHILGFVPMEKEMFFTRLTATMKELGTRKDSNN